MKLLRSLIILTTLFLTATTSAQENQEDIEVSYKKSAKPHTFKFSGDKNFEIIYFYSYSCPVCNIYRNYEKILSDYVEEKNSKYKKGKHISYHKVPVSFKPSWDATQDLSFFIKELELNYSDDEIYDYIFNGGKIQDRNDVAQFLMKKHPTITIDLLNNVADNSSMYKLRKKAALDLEHEFSIQGTPSLIITDQNGNSYLVDPTMNGLKNMVLAAIKITSS